MRLLTAATDTSPHTAAAPAEGAGGGVRVAGLGAALPRRRVTNHDLARYLDTSDEWIADRSGIRERRWAGPGESTLPLSLSAARAALTLAILTSNRPFCTSASTCRLTASSVSDSLRAIWCADQASWDTRLTTRISACSISPMQL